MTRNGLLRRKPDNESIAMLSLIHVHKLQQRKLQHAYSFRARWKETVKNWGVGIKHHEFNGH